MKKSKQIKIEKTLESKQIAAFLRLLASEIEGTHDEELKNYGVDLHNFNKIKVGLVQHEGGQLHLTLKIKDRGNSTKTKGSLKEPFEDVAALKYRPLKKKLSATFKRVKKHIAADELPPPATIAAFLHEAREMVSFPGFGDDYYHEFSKACTALETAFQENDFATFKELTQKISSLKNTCHSRYK